ncbi:MAG: penicillin acylase family protein [Chloroflexota bacterium]|nr:penicillin acylase family protein [Chloroflexota bacterium]MDE2920844.1 penicillin acylase family protein [Chloroflexota bacterium]
MLRQLGRGESIADVCAWAGVTEGEFEAWWERETRRRLAVIDGETGGPVGAAVEIQRDASGVPHIFAETEPDLFVGYGYAMAQDRLFQMDYLRRQAVGRLAEVLGPEAYDYDLLARTVGLHRIAEEETARLPAETAARYEAFAAGVNAFIEACLEAPPIEFDLLDYRPEPWRPFDSIALLGEFRWYLTGRLPVIAVPELAKRALGDGSLYRAFLTAEAIDETILHPGEYASGGGGSDPVELPVGGIDDGTGSNNWVIGPSRNASGAALVASDPHIAFGAPNCWYQAHLVGGRFNVAGAGYAGAPGILIGRNRRVAWGITNNISSQRDLYQERTAASHPRAFLYDGRWEPARERVEAIQVRGEGVREAVVQSSRNGPIVDEILPDFARGTGPVSLRWVGALPCGWPTSILESNAAESCSEFESALRGWGSPTLSMVFGDVDGGFGYRATGHVPIRSREERGYRRGWDPADAWQGMIPFEGMPAVREPERGWVATANNLPAPADFPYPLASMSPTGYRARRIRQMIETRELHSREDMASMQYDVLALRAVDAVPALVQILDRGDGRAKTAADALRAWDRCMDTTSAAAAIFEAFQFQWDDTVAAERFAADSSALAVGDSAAFVAGGIGSLSLRLLADDDVGWFASAEARDAAVRSAMNRSLDQLSERLGKDMSTWNWGRLHTLPLQHLLSGRRDLGQLLDRGGEPVSGNGVVVSNTGSAPDFVSRSGANYRLIADLAEAPAQMWTLDAAGPSGQPGSPYYANQFGDWRKGRYHRTYLGRSDVQESIRTTLSLLPRE